MTEAPTLRCKACGAAVGENDLQCPYCKSQLATVACPRCFGMVSVNAKHCPHCGQAIQMLAQDQGSKLHCPGCESPLVITNLGETSLHQCHTCGGLWLAKETFDQVAATHESRGQILGVLPGEKVEAVHASLDAIHYRPCPCCKKFMNRVNYARISKVIVDVCREHGIWFDRDELRHVLEFIDSGGLMRSQEREKLQIEEERSKLAAQQMAASMSTMGDAGSSGEYWGRRSGVDSVLDRLIGGAFNTILDKFIP